MNATDRNNEIKRRKILELHAKNVLPSKIAKVTGYGYGLVTRVIAWHEAEKVE